MSFKARKGIDFGAGLTLDRHRATETTGIYLRGGRLNVATGGLTINAGGLTVDAGGLTVTAGGQTITDGGLTVTAGGLTVTAGGGTITAGGLTVSDGVTALADDTGATTHAVTITNDTDNASVAALNLIGGTRATPADNDEVYLSFTLQGDTTEQEFARITGIATDVTEAGNAEDGGMQFDIRIGASLSTFLACNSGTDGTMDIGFFGATPAPRQTWTTTNVTTDRSIDANGLVAEIGDGLTSLIVDLQALGLLA